MENIREASVVAEAEQGPIELHYTLYSMPTVRGTESYGILLRNKTTDESAMVSDITESFSVAVHLFQQLIRCQVTTVTLRDVVEDFISDAAFCC